MSPAPVCSRMTLTVEVSALLFDALTITAQRSGKTVSAFIVSALLQNQIASFAEDSEGPSECDVVVLDARSTPPPSKMGRSSETEDFSQRRGSEPPMRGDLGPLQRAILDHLLDAPTMSGVYDLLEVRRAMLRSHSGPAVSRAVHQLVRRGVLEPMTPTSNRFRPDAGGVESKLRYVRRAGLDSGARHAIPEKVPPQYPPTVSVNQPKSFVLFGATRRDRTGDLLITNQPLYQLS
jgi:hypothetical protein